MPRSLTCLAVVLALCVTQPLAAPVAEGPTVSIADGIVIGTATGVSNQPSNTARVNAYLGVPFAESPPLRFAPPTKPKPWSSPLIAKTNPPACLQAFPSGEIGTKTRAIFNNPGGPAPAESEDCLYLNVFAPHDASATNLKPVLFWLFGGNLAFGTASLSYYNGSYLAANEDVVVVAINYRTNIFGFSNSPELPTGQQNAGYLDQRFALQWVQDNIAHFGGDPTKVTLFGESAGGYSIRDLIAHPPSPLPFRAAILESEGGFGSNGIQYEQVAGNFGCLFDPSPIACLRKVDGIAIRDYLINNNVEFFPVDDGITHSMNVLPQILSGKSADVPILMGTNKDEGRVFAYIAGITAANDTTFASVLSSFGLNLTPAELAAAENIYSSIADGPYELVSQIITDLIFTCRTSALSNALAQVHKSPVWRYRYDASFPDTSSFPDAGAYHSSEIPSVWGTYPLENAYGTVTADQIALAKSMTGIWAGFAKQPQNGPGWAKVGSSSGNYLGLLGGSSNPTGEHTVNVVEADAVCAVFTPLLVLADLAY